MARRSSKTTEISSLTESEKSEISKNAILGLKSFLNSALEDKYGTLNAPNPYVTPTGIKHLDTVLGGGIISSNYVMLTSTPETGKSTFAFQIAKTFLNKWKNTSIVYYFDIEGSGSGLEIEDDGTGSPKVSKQFSREELFGLTKEDGWQYVRKPLKISEFFNAVQLIISKKLELQGNIGTEIRVLIIVDSLTSLNYSRIDDVQDFDKAPGKRAAELTHYINKVKGDITMNRVTIVAIDQIRQNFSMKGLYEPEDERGVGTWRNVKSSSKISAVEHSINQWLFMSKRTELPSKQFAGQNVDGWILNFFIEKNKNAPSKIEISCVFDKIGGIDKFWSEYLFLSDYTPSENKLIRNGHKPFMDLCFKSSGAWTTLSVTNPETGESFEYSSKFYSKNVEELYKTDSEFREVFDKAVELSCIYRLERGLMKMKTEDISTEDTKIIEEDDENSAANNNKKSPFAMASIDSIVTESQIIEE